MSLIQIVGLILLAGAVCYGIGLIPFISAPWKRGAQGAIAVVVVIWLIGLLTGVHWSTLGNMRVGR